MKAIIFFLGFVFVAGCVTSSSKNRSVASENFYKEVLKPRCMVTKPGLECFDLHKRLHRRTRSPLPNSLRNYAYICISNDCPAGPGFESCVWDCFYEAQEMDKPVNRCEGWFSFFYC